MESSSLEERVQRMEDVHQIQNLMGRYVFWHTAGKHRETTDLFAQNSPGVKAEFPSWGIYDGNKSIERAFVGVHSFQDGDREGIMRMHTLTTPIIEVAKDGKTAKGAWISPGHETMKDETGRYQAYWAWCKYGCDFIKEGEKWKFWHVRVFGIFMTPYAKPWTEAGQSAIPAIPDRLKADRKGHQAWEYSPAARYPADEPSTPEPYETWNDALSYVQ